jgi:tetratricopeptide (TPR) repeat protein
MRASNETTDNTATSIARDAATGPADRLPLVFPARFPSSIMRVLRVETAIALLLVAAAVASNGQDVRETPAEAPAAQEAERAKVALAEAEWREWLEEVQAFYRKVLGPEHPDSLKAMHKLASYYDATGLRDEAMMMGEEVLALCLKVHGPQHPETLGAMKTLAKYYDAAGRRDEALKLREGVLEPIGLNQPATLRDMAFHRPPRPSDPAGTVKLQEAILELCRKVLGPEHSDTLTAMGNLANSYAAAGRLAEALALLAEASTAKPADTHLAMKAAALQAWLGKDAEHTATSQRMLAGAADIGNPNDSERVAKLACLRPIADATVQEAALLLARKAVELGKEDKKAQPWYQMTLGMAEYRSGHHQEADTVLGKDTYRPDHIAATAAFYRAMSLFQLGKTDEARTLFTATEATMKPLPEDDQNPGLDPDDLILWLAYKESKTLLQSGVAETPDE